MSDVSEKVSTAAIFGGGDSGSFKDSVPEAYREKSYMADIDSADKLFQQFDNAQQLIGKKTVGVPTAESSIDDWNSFYTKMGRPETSDKYEFESLEMPDAIKRSDDQNASLKKILHEAGLSSKQANNVVRKSDEEAMRFYNDSKDGVDKASKERQDAFQEKLSTHFGDNKDKAVAVTEGLLKKYVPKGLEEAVHGLDDSAMLILASVVNNMYSDGRSEDSLLKNGEFTAPTTKESMKIEAHNLMRSEAGRDNMHPQYDNTQKKIRELYQQMAQTQK